MIASVNLDVSIVNVTNESVAGRQRKGRGRERSEEREGRKKERSSHACREGWRERGRITRECREALVLVRRGGRTNSTNFTAPRCKTSTSR